MYFAGSRVASSAGQVIIPRKELIQVFRDDNSFKYSNYNCQQRLRHYIQQKFFEGEVPADCFKQLRDEVKLFVGIFLLKWKNSGRKYAIFLKRHNIWLEGSLKLTVVPKTPVNTTKGRPKSQFLSSSTRTKQRLIKPLVETVSPKRLQYAAESTLRLEGKRSTAKVVKMAINTTPRRLQKMEEAHDSSNSITPYSSEEALALMVDLGIGKKGYIRLQKEAKLRGANIYPAYSKIVEAKKQCYPPNISITETAAQVQLQDLLDLTIRRLITVQHEVLQRVPEGVTTINAIYKWGLDGSGGHSIYKQAFANNAYYADSNIILCSIVPLELSFQNVNGKIVLWKNSSPSSTTHCRPINFQLKKETDDEMKIQYESINTQISQLRPTNIDISNKWLNVNHLPVCTMIDGKTCNVLTATSSSQACNVCGATPKSMNDIPQLIKMSPNTNTYKFGISILHAYLRTFEYLLHIAYKLDIKKWQARGSSDKENVKSRKEKLSTLFYKEMGLVVDRPKQGGGNSNDGNTARKFFQNPKKVR